MSVETDTDPSLTDSEPQRVNLILDNPYGYKTAGNYLNPAAFERPAEGTFGNLGRSNIQSPGSRPTACGRARVDITPIRRHCQRCHSRQTLLIPLIR